MMNKAYCPFCGKEIHSNDHFCSYCGNKMELSQKHCQNCGTQIDEYTRTCPKCGYEIPSIPIKQHIKKSKVVAGLLGIFLGGLGIHNFYLGYSSKGFFQVVLFVFGLFTFGLTIFISSLWGFIEGIMIFSGYIDRDGDGHLLE